MLNENLLNFLNYTKEDGEFIYVNLIVLGKNDDTILIQKRTEHRKNFPNCWEFIGDYLRDDESLRECVIRSLGNSNLRLESILSLVHDFKWRGTAREVRNYIFLVKAKGSFSLNSNEASQFRYIDKKGIRLLLNETDRENEMHKSAYFAFGFLENYQNSLQSDIGGYNFQKFMQALLINYYEYLNIQENTPIIEIEDLPNGKNIETYPIQNLLKVDSKILTKSNVFFGAIVILHDLYHNLKQNIQSIDDVNTIRDLFGQNEMLIVDIDADIEIFIFFKKYYNYTFVKYLDTLYDGLNVFHDNTTRLPKVQRFIGSIISIYISEKGGRIIYFPSLSKISDSMYLLSFSKNGLQFNKTEIHQIEIDQIVELLKKPKSKTKTEFISILENFCKKIHDNLTA
jgi:8-oxo-dGTP diphosphatase